MPPGPHIEVGPECPIMLMAYPDPGYRVKSVLVDGFDKGCSPKLSMSTVSADTVVEYQFSRTFMNRTSKYTLVNKDGGIRISFEIERLTAAFESSLRATLFNSNNSLYVKWDSLGSCELGYSSVDPIGPTRLKDARKVAVPNGTTKLKVSLQLRGAEVSMYVATPDGMHLATVSGCLYTGPASMIQEGWVVAVDGSTSDKEGAYSLDITDFVVTADEKRPLISSSSFAKLSAGSSGISATGLE